MKIQKVLRARPVGREQQEDERLPSKIHLRFVLFSHLNTRQRKREKNCTKYLYASVKPVCEMLSSSHALQYASLDAFASEAVIHNKESSVVAVPAVRDVTSATLFDPLPAILIGGDSVLLQAAERRGRLLR